MPQLNKQNISCSLPHGNITHSNMKYQQNMIWQTSRILKTGSGFGKLGSSPQRGLWVLLGTKEQTPAMGVWKQTPEMGVWTEQVCLLLDLARSVEIRPLGPLSFWVRHKGQSKLLLPDASLHRESKKGATLTIAITLSILDRFAKFVHCCKEQ